MEKEQRSINPLFQKNLQQVQVVKEGFLSKRKSVLKNWKELWFVLRAGTLMYYVHKTDKKPRGKIQTLEITEISIVENTSSQKNCFRITTLSDKKKKVHLLVAKAPEERDAWIKALETARCSPFVSLPQFSNPISPTTANTNSTTTSPSSLRANTAPRAAAPKKPLAIHTMSQMPRTTGLISPRFGAGKNVRGSEEESLLVQSEVPPIQIEEFPRTRSGGLDIPRSSPSLMGAESKSLIKPTISSEVTKSSSVSGERSPRTKGVAPIVIAKYDYAAASDRELSFKANDKIILLRTTNSGWWLGELNGKIGHFPAAYVTLTNNVTLNDSFSQINIKPRLHNHNYVAPRGVLVRALYDYIGQTPTELSFKKGEEFLLLERLDSANGWWRGLIGDKKGHFPAQFVKIIDKDPYPQTERCKTTNATESSLEGRKIQSLGRVAGAEHKLSDLIISPRGDEIPAHFEDSHSIEEKIRDILPSSPEKEGEKFVLKKDTQLIGKYQLGDALGKGAFGLVHKGLNTETGAFVAIKQVPTKGVPKARLASIMTELEILKKLAHPNIVEYIGIIETKNNVSFILEYIEGGSLEGLIKKFGGLPEILIIRYTQQILNGLAYLHSQGVIHRDIKCGNILITKDGCVKLSDFGIATSISEMSGETGHGGSVSEGSPYWMAPEVIELRGACFGSDIWSLGCTIIELFTGDPPFSSMTPMAAIYAMVEEPHPPLPEGISELLRDFLFKCFQREPSDRPSASEILRHGFLQQEKGAGFVPPDILFVDDDMSSPSTETKPLSTSASSIHFANPKTSQSSVSGSTTTTTITTATSPNTSLTNIKSEIDSGLSSSNNKLARSKSKRKKRKSVHTHTSHSNETEQDVPNEDEEFKKEEKGLNELIIWLDQALNNGDKSSARIREHLQKKVNDFQSRFGSHQMALPILQKANTMIQRYVDTEKGKTTDISRAKSEESLSDKNHDETHLIKPKVIVDNSKHKKTHSKDANDTKLSQGNSQKREITKSTSIEEQISTTENQHTKVEVSTQITNVEETETEKKTDTLQKDSPKSLKKEKKNRRKSKSSLSENLGIDLQGIDLHDISLGAAGDTLPAIPSDLKLPTVNISELGILDSIGGLDPNTDDDDISQLNAVLDSVPQVPPSEDLTALLNSVSALNLPETEDLSHLDQLHTSLMDLQAISLDGISLDDLA